MAKALFSTSLFTLLLAYLFAGCAANETTSSTPAQEVIEPTIGSNGLTYEMDETGDFAICTGIGNATDTDIVIASHFEGVIVQEIASSAFYQNESVQSVQIPDGIKIINQKAFFECASLTTVEISSTVTVIGAQAFRNCPKLNSVTVEDNNKLVKINLHAPFPVMLF